MKKLILFLMSVPLLVSGQVADDFESGTLSGWSQGTEGHWKADTVNSLDGRFSLHHVFDNLSAGSDCIGLRLKNLHPGEGTTRWSFKIRHGYDPSSSNNWAVYLLSDRGATDFSDGSMVNGYAVGVNLAGYDDSLRLWKINNGSASVVTVCPVNWQTGIGTTEAAEIIAERNISGRWTLSVFTTGNILRGTSSGYDIQLFASDWFIINYRYTSTRDRLLWFDDLKIEGVFYKDTLAPIILQHRVKERNAVDISFNEELPEEMTDPSRFMINTGSDTATGVEKISAVTYRLYFKNEFLNKEENRLVIKQLCDRNSNCINDYSYPFTPAWAVPGDVMISEIMADPVPAVGLPQKEYIEIYNRTKYAFNLGNWRLSSGDQETLMPSVSIQADEHIILCSLSDTASFSGYGRTLGIKSFPVLTDAGKLLVLKDSLGDLIHGVDYSSSWYGDKLKSAGGWSLEMIDCNYPFYDEGNWEASVSGYGGTPGKTNSVMRFNKDGFFKGILNVFPVDENLVTIEFSEPLTDLLQLQNDISIDGNDIRSVTPADPLMRLFNASLEARLIKGRIYQIRITGDITDFAGNTPGKGAFSFGITEIADKGDIVFNELLFNPFSGEPDYIELYNGSDKILDASDLFLASVSTQSGDTSEVKALSPGKRCILPGAYYVGTTDCNKVIERYPYSDPDAVHFVSQLPSMPDDKGHLLLLNRRMELIDEVIYSDAMHSVFFAGNEGISLEKIRPDMNSYESTSWHSASESCGWGTPGKANSVFISEPGTIDRIVLSSERISPDNDGFEDLLVVDLKLAGLGNVVSAEVFDETGHHVKNICRNFFAGARASLVWDGKADDGSLVREGIYIIFIETYNDRGKTKSWKKVCAVII